jgi:hypothetical protein
VKLETSAPKNNKSIKKPAVVAERYIHFLKKSARKDITIPKVGIFEL